MKYMIFYENLEHFGIKLAILNSRLWKFYVLSRLNQDGEKTKQGYFRKTKGIRYGNPKFKEKEK